MAPATNPTTGPQEFLTVPEAARLLSELMQLVGEADPEDFSVKDVMEALEPERQRLGHDEESRPGETGALNAALIDELAQDVDDRTEEIHARSDEPEDDDSYEDEGDHEDEAAFDWFEQTYTGLRPRGCRAALPGSAQRRRQR